MIRAGQHAARAVAAGPRAHCRAQQVRYRAEGASLLTHSKGAGGTSHNIEESQQYWHDPVLRDQAMKIPTKKAKKNGKDELAGLPDTTDILDAFNTHLENQTRFHAGYPYNLDYDFRKLRRFLKYSINNLGDPFVMSNYGVHSRPFETAVIDFFAHIWEFPKDGYWGYVTSCGTEGNLHSILVARECHPDAVLITSKETHYSVPKAARAYRMECVEVDTIPNNGEIDYDKLNDIVAGYGAEGRSMILNVNLGTTVRGAVDDLHKVIQIMEDNNIPREKFHIHCDGALFGMMMPFVSDNGLSFDTMPIDSIAVSGHKFLGCPMPCGITLTRKEHIAKMSQEIEYLNSVDTTIMGSRNGHAALFMWYALRAKGVEGLKNDVETCFENARYLHGRLLESGVKAERNDLSTTVVFERPPEDFVQRWQLACEGDIAHMVVMQNHSKTTIDAFCAELELARVLAKQEQDK